MRGKARLRQALAEHPPRQSWFSGPAALLRSRGLALAGMLMTLVLLTTTAVIAASGPGQIGYGLRVAGERVPALLQTTALGRATNELRVADRRLDDLKYHLERSGEISTTAMDALMAGDEAAIQDALTLDRGAQTQIATRVAAHAAAMNQLAAAHPEALLAERLQLAARWAYTMAEHLRAGQPLENHWPDPQLPPLVPGPNRPDDTPAPTPATADPTPTRAWERRQEGYGPSPSPSTQLPATGSSPTPTATAPGAQPTPGQQTTPGGGPAATATGQHGSEPGDPTQTPAGQLGSSPTPPATPSGPGPTHTESPGGPPPDQGSGGPPATPGPHGSLRY